MLALLLAASVVARDTHPQPANGEYVEYDFSSVPERMGHRWDLTLQLRTTHKDVTVDPALNIDVRFSPITLAAGYASLFEDAGCKVELVDKLKVRVYGCTVKDKFYPAVSAKVISPQVTADRLPKVTNPARN
jgi:hypothetical protein